MIKLIELVNELVNWVNRNQGLVSVLLFVLGIIGYLIRRFIIKDRTSKTLVQKQKGGDDSSNIQAGRDINISR